MFVSKFSYSSQLTLFRFLSVANDVLWKCDAPLFCRVDSDCPGVENEAGSDVDAERSALTSDALASEAPNVDESVSAKKSSLSTPGRLHFFFNNSSNFVQCHVSSTMLKICYILRFKKVCFFMFKNFFSNF